MKRKFEKMESKFDNVEGKVDNVEQKVNTLLEILGQLKDNLSSSELRKSVNIIFYFVRILTVKSLDFMIHQKSYAKPHLRN